MRKKEIKGEKGRDSRVRGEEREQERLDVNFLVSVFIPPSLLGMFALDFEL